MPHRALRQFEHRDLPLPGRPWAMSMRWRELLFMHFPVEPAVLREAVPGDFDLDLFDGMAWVGVVPFRMEATRPRLLPAIPHRLVPVSPSSFPELNLRTYVTVNTKDGPLPGKLPGQLPGVLFFSLDAASWSAVRLARFGFQLPYFDARMQAEREPGDNGWVHFQSVRTHFGAPAARFAASYRPRKGAGPVTSTPGSFEHFLTERYRLFTLGRKGRGVRVGEIAHAPWPLQQAECDLSVCEMTGGLGFELPTSTEPVLHYADRLDVVAWRPRRV